MLYAVYSEFCLQVCLCSGCQSISLLHPKKIYFKPIAFALSLGTVENHGTKWQKMRQTSVKIAKITTK